MKFGNMYEKEWGQSLPSSRGLTVVEIMNAIHKDKIKGMYIMGENPAMSDPGRCPTCAQWVS